MQHEVLKTEVRRQAVVGWLRAARPLDGRLTGELAPLFERACELNEQGRVAAALGLLETRVLPKLESLEGSAAETAALAQMRGILESGQREGRATGSAPTS